MVFLFSGLNGHKNKFKLTNFRNRDTIKEKTRETKAGSQGTKTGPFKDKRQGSEEAARMLRRKAFVSGRLGA